MTTAQLRTCRSCGAPLSSNNPGVKQCGRCQTKRIAAAHAGHIYQRVHVHEWPDGSKSIETGTSCECQEDK